MDKNDFDIDFDFEKEYGFDPEEFLSSDNPGDFDLSELDDLGVDTAEEESTASGGFMDYDLDEPNDYDEDFTAGIDFKKRQPVEQPAADDGYEPLYAQDEPAEDAEPEAVYDDGEIAEEDEEQNERPARRQRKKPELKMPKMPEIDLSKIKMPSFITKFVALYFGPLKDKNYGIDETAPEGSRRRRKPSRARIIKEVYLPPIILCLSLLLVLSFVIGSISNSIKLKKISDNKAKNEAQIAAQEADKAEENYQAMLVEAEKLATEYDYLGAVELLKTYTGDNAQHVQELTEKKAEYVNIHNSLSEWKDVNSIANLSFHMLIADPARAFADKEYGGQYNRNFVTTGEFQKILEQLYSGGYVLVDFDSFVGSAVGLDGNKSFSYEAILLPGDKKPIMITETMVNYFGYMVDSNKDGEPDAGGAGFANKLVLTQTGEIKAQIVDAAGQTQVGNYDLVPILEDFIKAHPDFVYRGARATLAVTGYEGVFGYRTNTSYISSKSQEFYEQECAEARVLVDALREKGYTIASYTYNNEAYRNLSVAQIKADIQNWTAQITPILGNVEVMVFARASDIDDYSGNKFSVLYDAGFRYFVSSANAPKADVFSNYVRQSRLMVTGNALGWQSSMFTNYFDCNAVVDMSSRGSIPN